MTRDMKTRNNENILLKTPNEQEIAVIGLSLRFPKSETLDEFWEHLVSERSLITEVPKDRWDKGQFFGDPRKEANKTNSIWGGFIDEADCFDASFFKISPREATYMDPQQRIILELAWKAVEDAGYGAGALKESKTGVFIGACNSDYTEMMEKHVGEVDAYIPTGASYAILANRISYWFDFRGPSITIDTACASSLAAVHQGVRALQNGDCEYALAGGVNLCWSPRRFIALSQSGMLSKDGKCKAFDEKADGYVRGEGGAILVLKPLHRAIKDQDHIYTVIKGIGTNHGGRTNSLTVTNPKAQADLIAEVYKKAEVSPDSVSYIETHGPGTPLGDPIEILGLKAAFSQLSQKFNKKLKKSTCGLGSVKTNVGHLESAAGIAGIIKVIAAMQHKILPASIHFNQLNPVINLSESPFYIVSKTKPWEGEKSTKESCHPRRAGVSSFGFGGSNAHILLEEYIPIENPAENPLDLASKQLAFLIPLSAQNADRLGVYAEKLLDFLRKNQKYHLGDIAYTLQIGREPMEERVIFLAKDQAELVSQLEAFIQGKEKIANCWQGQVNQGKEIVSLFTEDEDSPQLIIKWISKGRVEKIAQLWVKGVAIDWELFYKEHPKPCRISLPTYPFARERYWMPEKDMNSSGIIKTSISTDCSLQRKICYMHKQWEPCFVRPTKIYKRIIAILATEETEGLAIRLAKCFPKSEIIKADHLASQTKKRKEEWKSYDGIVDLVGCGKNEDDNRDWIVWLQRMIEYGHQEGLMMLCVTKGLESYRNKAMNLAGASRVGLYRMLQSEYSHLCSRHLDVDPSSDDITLAEQIASEFSIDDENIEICYRKGERYRAYLQKQVDEDNNKPALVFPQDHVLWITGGTRGLGFLCARHFVAEYGVKHLVLTGRESFPSREQWSSYQDDSLMTQKIKAIKALEEQGAQVRVLSLPLTDGTAVKGCLDEINNTLGPVGGVIHCAGIVDRENPAFIRKNLPGIEGVLAPKKAGLDTLMQIFHKEPLAFFILFSSVSAIIPTLGSGQSDYAMANAYMDYFAEANAADCPIVSIQWPSWQETGMGEVKSRAYQQTGMLSHSNREGLELLDHILSQRVRPVVLPAVVNPELWEPGKLMQRKMQKNPAVSISSPHSLTVEEAKTPDNLMKATQAWLVALFSKELKIEPAKLAIDTPFQDYGMDSILIAQVITVMDRELECTALEPSALIEYPTIKSLAGYMVQNYPQALSSLFSFEAVTARCIADEQITLTTGQQEEHKRLHVNKVHHSKEKIAIVGMACHFPDAANISAFWENLELGKDSIREVPKARWDWGKFYDPAEYRAGKSISKWGAFLDRIEEFDPGFFQIPESLAPHIDPLQRQWLEVSAEALADAGYEKNDLWGKQVGVFVGARTANFANKYNGFHKDRLVGTGQNFLAAHLAHIYNFRGPNIVIDTACSSSLTAIHLAVRSIQNNEAEIALAGGVDILLDETHFLILSYAKILSPHGRCKTFDASADGIGIGEGCGVLVLKPLSKALQDNDKIYGVIDGTAVNNDGNTMGITTPNPDAQQELIEMAIRDADINPETISYVETHGTGTLIGDPIELKGLSKIFTKYTTKKQFCGVGSVKTNFGHLLSAAGAASMVKVLLAIIHQKLPPTLHCSNPNPRFNFKESPFFPVRELQIWTNEQEILRAGISAFGLGGNNAHIIVSNEGVPESQRAILEPKGKKIVFNRKRYWPSSNSNTDVVWMDEEMEFRDFFESRCVEMGSEKK